MKKPTKILACFGIRKPEIPALCSKRIYAVTRPLITIRYFLFSIEFSFFFQNSNDSPPSFEPYSQTHFNSPSFNLKNPKRWNLRLQVRFSQMGASTKWIKSLIGYQKSNSNSSDQVNLFDFFFFFNSYISSWVRVVDSIGYLFFVCRRRLGVTKPGHGSYGGVHQLEVLLFHHQKG